MLLVTMMISLLQYDIGYSKICSVDPTSDIVENAALNKPASQISDYSRLGVASHAVDGDNNPQYFDGSCTHTKAKDPRLYRWWMVDLEREYRIDSLNITNRAGSTASKLRDFDIFVSLNSTFEDDDHMTDDSLCVHVSGEMGSGETRKFTCQTPVFGQFVQIFMETPKLRNLHMCEITVQGYPAVCNEDTTITAPPMCLCQCNASLSTSTNLTQEEMVELVKELAKELTVNKKETSRSKRKFISVGDERQSAEAIGCVGVLALCGTVLLIVSFDLINLWSFLKHNNKRKEIK